MRNPLESIIQNNLNDPTAPITLTERYGLVLRYGSDLWRKECMAAFRISYTCNALLISILTERPHLEITKNPRGIEATFQDARDALSGALALMRFLESKEIPASIVLFKAEGISDESGQWFSGESYRAEKIALCSPAHELRLTESFHTDLEAPEGVGVFHVKAAQRVQLDGPLYLARDYR